MTPLLRIAAVGTALAFACVTLAGIDVPPLGQVNTDRPEHGLVRGPDGWYVTRHRAPWGENGAQHLLRLDEANPEGTAPRWSDGSASESDFFFSKQLSRACFVRADDASDDDIWCMNWRDGNWSAATRLPEPLNSPAREYSPVLARDGSLWFASDRAGGKGQGDLYRAVRRGDAWHVENLGPALNSPHGEWNLALAPDESFLLFESSGRPGNRSMAGDLYRSDRHDDGWRPPVPLSLLNSDGSDLMPRFQEDGSLLYGQSRGDDANIVAAPLADLEPLAPAVVAVARSSGEVVVLEPGTLKERARYPAGSAPHDVAASEDGRRALVPSHGVAPVPHAGPISPAQMSWQNGESSGLRWLDLLSGHTTNIDPPFPCPRAHGAAASAQADRVWITCENAGHVIALRPGTRSEPAKIVTEPGIHKLMHLDRAGVVVGSNPDTGSVAVITVGDNAMATVRTGNGAEALAASEDQQRIYVANSLDAQVCALTVQPLAPEACWPSGGAFPIALAVDERARRLWVANNASANVTALSLDNGALIATYELPSSPLGIAFDARHRHLYVGLPRLNSIIVLDADTGEEIARNDGVMEVDDIDLVPRAWFGAAPDT